MPITDALTAVREAERRRFESVWIVESSLTPGKDAVSYLGALAVSTERIGLATGVINIFSRSATLIASTVATLDEISKGRMMLGIETAIAQVSEGMAKELTLVGSPEECSVRIDAYRRAGVRLPIVFPFYTEGDLNSNVALSLETFGH